MSNETDDIAAILAPFIHVTVWTALHHHWQAPHPPFTQPPVVPTLWLVRRGIVNVTTPGQTFHLTPGMIFLSQANITRTVEAEGQGEWFSIALTAQAFQQIDLFSLLPLPSACLLPVSARETFETLMSQLIQEWGSGVIPSSINPSRWFTYVHHRVSNHHRHRENLAAGLESSLICEGIARSLFALCWRHFSTTPLTSVLKSNVPDWLAPVLRRANDDPGVPVTELARIAHLSPTRFRVVFHEWAGASPQQYLTERRMETARHLLLSTNDTIASIAARVGMQSLPTFTRLFKATYGFAPGKYRHTSRRFPGDGGVS